MRSSESLHSMRSLLSPRSAAIVSGSAPMSSQHTGSTYNSGSSRRSTPSHARTASSGFSLAHSGSISSDGRRRFRPSPGQISPPISAVGHANWPHNSRFSVHTDSPRSLQFSVHAQAPLALSGTVTSSSTTGTGGASSSVTTHTSVADPITGEVMRFPHVSWTGGLESPSVREADEGRGAWSGSWNTPSHFQALQKQMSDHQGESHT